MKTIIRRLAWGLSSALLIAGIAGCAAPTGSAPSTSGEYTYNVGEKPEGEVSLFPGDASILTDEQILKVLTRKVEVPAKSRIALLRLTGSAPGFRGYGPYYISDEGYLKLQQEQVDSLSGTLRESERISEVIVLPSILTPKEASVGLLREAAVRLQADLLLVFRARGDTYWKYRMFAKDSVKSYSTCELVVVDVRSGLIPFTRIVTRERTEKKESSDLDLGETMRRTEALAAAEALAGAARDLNSFLASAPVRE
jgi:hypothetical protein